MLFKPINTVSHTTNFASASAEAERKPRFNINPSGAAEFAAPESEEVDSGAVEPAA